MIWKNNYNMKEIKFYVITLLWLLCCGPLPAQDLLLIKKFPVLKNDSVTGYCFIYKQERVDKQHHKFILELYNQEMVRSDNFSFMVEKEYSTAPPVGTLARLDVKVMDNIVIFPLYWYDMNGDIGGQDEMHLKFVVIDLVKKQVVKEAIMDKGEENITMDKWFFQKNNRIVKVVENSGNDNKEYKHKYGKNVKVVEWYDFSLNLLGALPLKDERSKQVDFSDAFLTENDTLCIYIRRYNEWAMRKQLYDYDLWFISMKDGKIVSKIPVNSEIEKTVNTPSALIQGATPGEYIIAGTFFTLMDEKGFLGMKKAESLGIVAWKINFNDKAASPVRKEFLWKQTFGKYLSLNETGQIGKNNFAQIQKLFMLNGKVNVLFSIQKTVRESGMVGLGFYSGVSIYMPLPKLSEELTAVSAMKHNLYLLELDKDLTVVGIYPISGAREAALSFDDEKYFDADMKSYYSSRANSITIISRVVANKRTPFKKDKVVVLLYAPGQPLKADEFDVSEKATSTEFFPAKQGFIVIVEYFEKEKRLSKRIEKLNY